jgi:hypothetical protein
MSQIKYFFLLIVVNSWILLSSQTLSIIKEDTCLRNYSIQKNLNHILFPKNKIKKSMSPFSPEPLLLSPRTRASRAICPLFSQRRCSGLRPQSLATTTRSRRGGGRQGRQAQAAQATARRPSLQLSLPETSGVGPPHRGRTNSRPQGIEPRKHVRSRRP